MDNMTWVLSKELADREKWINIAERNYETAGLPGVVEGQFYIKQLTPEERKHLDMTKQKLDEQRAKREMLIEFLNNYSNLKVELPSIYGLGYGDRNTELELYDKENQKKLTFTPDVEPASANLYHQENEGPQIWIGDSMAPVHKTSCPETMDYEQYKSLYFQALQEALVNAYNIQASEIEQQEEIQKACTEICSQLLKEGKALEVQNAQEITTGRSR